MAWAQAKAQIKLVLEGVAITSPVALSMTRVYDDEPASIQDLPCAIIYTGPGTSSRSAGGLRRKIYEGVQLRIMVLDQDHDQAVAIVDAFREAVIDAFDTAVCLNGAADFIDPVKWASQAGFSYGGRQLTGVDVFLTVQLTEARSFEA